MGKAKWQVRIQFYDSLETNEGEAEIYKVAKRRTRVKKYVGKMKVIRSQELQKLQILVNFSILLI